MIRIFIADDHAIVREGLKQILSDTSDMKVVDEAENGPEALSKLIKIECDIAILDISMPGLNGVDVLKEIKSIKKELPVLILSIHPEEHYAVHAFRSGASGYLTKKSAPEELIQAIRKVTAGGKYVSNSLAEKLVFEFGTNYSKAIHESLSRREFQVMCMIASGKTTKDISNELSLSEKTISTYRSRILQKMKMKNSAEIIHYALRMGLVD